MRIDTVAAIRRVDLECDEFEVMWVELKIAKFKVFCYNCYRPPKRNKAHCESFLVTLQNAYNKIRNVRNSKVILIGDLIAQYSSTDECMSQQRL